jgi:integrase
LVSEQLAAHVFSFPPVDVELTDIIRGDPEVRTASLLFTSAWKRPLTYKKWSLMWTEWRKAAGWPLEGTFHSLRHFLEPV